MNYTVRLFAQRIFCLLFFIALLLVASKHSFAATIVVTTTSDNSGSACTLRRAIESFNTGFPVGSCNATGSFGTDDTVQLSTPNGSTIQLLNTSIPVSASLIILGPGRDALTITPAMGERGFEVDNAGAISLTVKDIHFSGTNRSGFGGVFFIKGALTQARFENVRFSQNHARFGGSLQIEGSDLTVISSEFINNSAQLEGAAIYQRDGGSISVHDSQFRLNRGFVGLQFNDAASGGAAIYAEGPSRFAITQSEFSQNQLLEDLRVNGQGGAVTILSCPDVSIGSARFIQNTGGYGGALYVRSSKGTIGTNLFKSNNGLLGGAAFLQSNAQGGDLLLIANTYLNNSAKEHGGAVFSFSGSEEFRNSTFANNQATLNGGAVFANSASSVTVNHNTFISNIAMDNGGALNSNASTLVFQNNLLLNNRADNDGADINSFSTTFTTFKGNFIGDSQLSTQDSINGVIPPVGNLSGTSDSQTPASFEQLLEPLDTNVDPLDNENFGTPYYLPKAGTLIINTAANVNCPFNDQRGRLRDDGACDIGAVELVESDLRADSNMFVVPLPNGKVVIFDL